LLASKGKSWLTSGWSLDAITTETRGGLGVAKDLFKNNITEVDLGAYLTQDYDSLFQGRFAPRVGVGLNVRF
jgi:hypothetical protein